ncbi:hypothetical protein F4604DRAFT_1932355 [Suillus subluteus]|nr:hypothetical protein F4604DRAFT_1932355 [Suillus subluteus]
MPQELHGAGASKILNFTNTSATSDVLTTIGCHSLMNPFSSPHRSDGLGHYLGKFLSTPLLSYLEIHDSVPKLFFLSFRAISAPHPFYLSAPRTQRRLQANLLMNPFSPPHCSDGLGHYLRWHISLHRSSSSHRSQLDHDIAICSMRNILAWVTFFANAACSGSAETSMSPAEIFHHAAHATFLDNLGSLRPAASFLLMLVPVKEAERSYAFDASKLGSFTVDEDPLKSVLHEVVKDFQGPFWTGSRSPSSGPTVLHDPHVVISFWRKSFQMPVQLCHRSPDLSFASPRIVFLLHSVTKILRMKRGHYCIAFGSYHQFE